MAGTASEDFAVGRSFEGGSSAQQRSQANSEALAEWRSSEQVENGSPSTSLPYWDSDDDDDHGPKPSQLYYKYTWKIEKFSQINKRELKSNVFDVGGYKWYILIYPQGCDVSNHLSLFLCVANHEKLLPGWSHFAQFTIAVVNKDPKKSKYSDTLHRFWKKEHDWGWKKFMELAKVSYGFLDADTLVIKAQVQVIRERVDRPFRCLDFQYRRELVRVYLTNIEQICRRFVEEKRCKLGKLLEDKARWSSFCAFWLGIDQNARWRMSREKTDSLLKVVVKHFFVEKEVTSTLVMDSLFSGLKALEGETQTKQGGLKNLESVELSGPIVFMEKDTFILADDVLLLLERAATEPLPPKDDKGAQNRTKDGGSGEDFSKDSIERDERRLTELGRKTIEIFVLAHIFSSKIEVAYQEAVALKRQEELIREEEASWIAESEQKSKRGVADKDKKSKKKQGKHKRNSHKGKEKGKNEKPDVVVEDKPKPEIHADRRNQFLLEEVDPIGNPNPEEDVSDMSDSINAVPELLHPDSEDRDSSPVWDTDASEAILLTESSSSGITGFLGVENRDRKSSSMMDDSSSTCSTDSLPSVTTMNGTSQVDSFQKQKSQDTPRRGNQQGRMTPEATGLAFDACSKRSDAFSDGRQLHDVSESSKAAEFGGAVVHLLQQHAKGPVVKHVTKEEKDYTLQRKLTVTEGISADKTAELKTTGILSSPKSPPKNLPYAVQLSSELKPTATSNTILITKSSSESPTRADKTASANSTETTVLSNAYAQKTASPKPVVKSTALPVPISTANSMALAVPTSTANSMALHVPISTTNVMGKQVPDLTENAKVHKQFSTDERPMPQALLTTEKPAVPQVMFRPLSAPLVPGSQPPRPVISVVHSVPALAQSANEASRLVPEPSSPVTPSHVTHSYRNIIMGNHVTTCSSSYSQPQSPNSAVNPSYSYSQSQPPALCSPPNYFLTKSEKTDPISIGPGHSFGMIGHGSLANISSTSINRNPLVVNNMHSGSQWIDNSRMDNSRSINYDPPLHNDTRNLNNYNPMQNMSRDHFPVKFTPDTSGSQNHSALTEAFPHLDIINDLLDDEYGVELTSNASSSVQNFINEPHHLNRQLTCPRDIRMGGGSGPSISSCRLERSHSYRDNEFRYNYNSAGGQFHPNLNPQANNLHLYPNIQVDGLLPNQWQMAGTNLSYSNMRSLEDDGLSYSFPNYPNLSCGVNGYTMFRPSNGH